MLRTSLFLRVGNIDVKETTQEHSKNDSCIKIYKSFMYFLHILDRLVAVSCSIKYDMGNQVAEIFILLQVCNEECIGLR